MERAGDNEDFQKMQRYGAFLTHLVGKYWNEPGRKDWTANVQKMADFLKEENRRVRPDIMKKANKILQRIFDEERGMAIPLDNANTPRLNPRMKSEQRERSDSPPFESILRQIEADDELQIWQSRGSRDQTPRSPSPDSGYGMDSHIRPQPRPIPTHKPSIPVIPLEEAASRHKPFQQPQGPPTGYSKYHPPYPPSQAPPPPSNYSAPYHNNSWSQYDNHQPYPNRMNVPDRGPRSGPWDRPPPEYYMDNSPRPVNHDYPNHFPPNGPPHFHPPRHERDYRDFQEDRPNSSNWTSFEQPPPVRHNTGTIWRGPPGAPGPPMGNYPPNEPYGRPRMDTPPIHSNSLNRPFDNRRGLLPHPQAGPFPYTPPPRNRSPLLPNPPALQPAPHLPHVAPPSDRNSFTRPNKVWDNAPPPLKPTLPAEGNKTAPNLPEDTRVRRESGGSKDGAKRMSYEEYRQRRSQEGGQSNTSNSPSGYTAPSATSRPNSSSERPGFTKDRETHSNVPKNDPRTKSSLYTPNRTEPPKPAATPREEATPVSPLDSLYQPPSTTVPVTGKGYGVQRFKIPKKRPDLPPPSSAPSPAPLPMASPPPVPPPMASPPPAAPPMASPPPAAAPSSTPSSATPSSSAAPPKELQTRRSSTSGSESAEPARDTPTASADVPSEAAKESENDAPLEIIEAYIKKALPSKEAQDIIDKLRKLGSAKEQSTIYREIQEFQEDAEDENEHRRILPRRAKSASRARVLSSSEDEEDKEESTDKEAGKSGRKDKAANESGTTTKKKKKASKTMLDRLREDVVDFYKRFDVTELDKRKAKSKDSTAEKQVEERSSSSGHGDEAEKDHQEPTGKAKDKPAKRTPTKAGGGKNKKGKKVTKPKTAELSTEASEGETAKRGRGRPKKTKNFAPTHLSLRGKRSMYVNEEEANDESDEPYHTCPLCEYVCVNIIQHYVSEHPGIEVPFAKFPEVVANVPGPPTRWPTYAKMPSLHWIPDKWVGGSSLKCQLCPPPAQAFDRRWQCLEHALSHALPPGTIFSCLWCKAEFENLYTMQDHVTVHTGEYRYTCGYCSHKSASLEGIEAHMGSLHTTQDRHFFEVEAAHVDRDTFWLNGYVCSRCNYAQLHEGRVRKHIEGPCAVDGAEVSRVAFLRVEKLATKEEKETGNRTNVPTVHDGQSKEEEEDLDRELEAMAQAVPSFVVDESEEEGELVSTVEVEDTEIKPQIVAALRFPKAVNSRESSDEPSLDAPQKDSKETPSSQPESTIADDEPLPPPTVAPVEQPSEVQFLRIESVETLCTEDSSVETAAAPQATPTDVQNQAASSLLTSNDTTEASSTPKETEDESNEDKEAEEEGEGLTGHALFRCGHVQCNFSSMSSAELKDHLNDCPLIKTCKQLVCRVCERPFRQALHLLEHLPLHGAKRFSCGLCQYRTPLANHVKKHLKSVHKVTQWEMIPQTLPVDQDNGNFGIFPREVVTPTMRLKAGLPPASPNKAGTVVNGVKLEPGLNYCGNNASMKLTYSMDDVNSLPHKSIFTTALRCAHCTYFSKVRTNLVRHLNLHQNATLPVTANNVDAGDKDQDNNNAGVSATNPVALKTEIPTQAPINPVPCLEKKERMFDKMTNLAYSSHATEPRNLRTHVSPTEMAQLPKFVEEHQRFVCGYKDCRYLTVNESMLKCHLVTLHKDEVFACVHCPDPESGLERPSYSLEAFRAHLRLHGSRLYKCGYCIYHHYQRQIIERHLNDKHPHQPPRECVIRGPEDEITIEAVVNAPQVARTDNSATKNARTLATPDKTRYAWRCSMCKFGHDIESALEQHINSVHGIGARFKCSFCAFVAPERSVVETHAAQDHEGQDAQVLIMFYKMDVTDYEQLEGPAPAAPPPSPLWKRDETRVRHIRGILLEESNMKATAPVATILPSSPDKRARRIPETTGGVAKQETVDKDLSIEPQKINVPNVLGEPEGKFLVCPLCPSFRAMATRDMREHLYRKFNYKKYKCAQCDAANWSRKAMIRHVQTVHLLGSDFVALDNSQPEFDKWVEQVLRHQTTVLNRPLRMRKWHKVPSEDGATSSPTKRPRLSPPTIKPEIPEATDVNTVSSVSELSSEAATPIKPEPMDQEAADLPGAPTPVDNSEIDASQRPPSVDDEDTPPANARPRGRKRPRQISTRNLRNAQIVNTPTGEQEFHCPACTYNCTSAKDMEKHVNKTCPVLFPAPSTSHDGVPGNEKFVCAYCPVTGPNHETLRDHYDEVHYPAFLAENSVDSQPFQVRPYSSEKNTPKVPRPKPTGQYRCQHCKLTGEYEAMRQHSADVHPQLARRLLKVQPKKLPPKKTSATTEIFVCDWCQARVSSEEEIKKHHDEKHPANVVRFSTLPAQETLGTTANGDSNAEQEKLVYQCPLCAFKSVSQLGTMNHLTVHCKPYQCSKCSTYFLTEGSGIAHIAKKHPNEQTLCKIPSAVTALELLRQQVHGRPLQENETGFSVRKNKGNSAKTNDAKASETVGAQTSIPTKSATESVTTSPASTPTVPVPVLTPIQATTSGVSYSTSPRKLLPLPTLSLLPTVQPARSGSKLATSPPKMQKLRAVARKSTTYRFSQETRPKKPSNCHEKEVNPLDLKKVTAYIRRKGGIPIKVSVAAMAKLMNLDAQLILEDCSKQPQGGNGVTKDEAESDSEEDEEEVEEEEEAE